MKRVKYILDKVKLNTWKRLNDQSRTRVRLMVSSHCSECGYGYSSDEALFSPSMARHLVVLLWQEDPPTSASNLPDIPNIPMPEVPYHEAS